MLDAFFLTNCMEVNLPVVGETGVYMFCIPDLTIVHIHDIIWDVGPSARRVQFLSLDLL